MAIYLVWRLRAGQPVRAATITRRLSHWRTSVTDRLSDLLFCLAPRGVYRLRPLLARTVGSYSAFSPLPALLAGLRRFVFCDTIRRKELSFSAPPFSQGMLPYGVRTFLSRASRDFGIGHPPLPTPYGGPGAGSIQIFAAEFAASSSAEDLGGLISVTSTLSIRWLSMSMISKRWRSHTRFSPSFGR